jgi:predicted Holliday junction resolvase-like endonuclease
MNGNIILLIIVFIAVAVFVGFIIGYTKGRGDEAGVNKKSQHWRRSILGGIFSEQVAPFLPGFPKDLKASEARFIGKPIDFIFFKGMDDQNITEVVFVEVKSGNSRLSRNESWLRGAILEKRVRWEEYHIPDEIAKIKQEEENI